MQFSPEEYDLETRRTLKFALETARVRLKLARSAEQELQSLADIIATCAKSGLFDAEGLARQAVRRFRGEDDKSSPASQNGDKPSL